MAHGDHYFKKLSGTIRLSNGRPRRMKWGEVIPPESEMLDGELDRLLRHGHVATQAEWDAGEKIPHHKRVPHRSGIVDPRSLRDPEPATPPVRTGATESAPEPTQGLDLAGMGDDALLALWDGGHAPKVKDLVAAVGSDSALAARVLDAEEAGTGGQSRSTLTDKLGKIVEAGE